MKKAFGLCLLLALVGAPVAFGQWDISHPESYNVRIEPRVWFSTDVDVDVDFDGRVNNRKVDVSADSDFDKETRFAPFFEIQPWEGHRFRFGFFSIDQDENMKVRDVKVRVDGQRVDQSNAAALAALGVGAKARLDADIFELGYQYALWSGDWGFVGPLIDIAIVSYDVEARATYSEDGQAIAASIKTLKADDSRTVPIPQIGLGMRVYPHERVAVCAEVKGMTVGDKGTLFQAAGGLEVSLNQNFAISGGYRYLRLDVDVSDVEVTYADHGPYVGAVVRF